MNKIKILRNEFNISQEELAQKLNLSKGIISLYENGERKPSLDVLIKLSEIFDCSIDYLLGKSDKRNNDDIDLSKVNIAQDTGIDVNGLSDEELEEIKKQVEFMKWKKQQKENK